MKNLYKIGLVILFLIGTMVLAIRADAAEISESRTGAATSYTVSQTPMGYALYKSTETETSPYFAADKLSYVIEKISGESSTASIFFSSVTTEEEITISAGAYTLQGKLSFIGDGFITVNGASLFLSEAEISSENIGIRVKKGSLCIADSSIFAIYSAIVMDYFSSSELTIESGEIFSSSSEALKLSAGSTKIKGGEIKSTGGEGIHSSATLILVGEPSVIGVDYDIIASSPVTLSDEDTSYKGKCKLKYCAEFSKGEIAIVAYGAAPESEDRIELYDNLGHRINVKYYDSFFFQNEKNFLTAFVPYEVKIIDGEESKIQYKLFGETLDAPTLTEKVGYEFAGWREGSPDGELYEPNLPIVSDLELYSSYNLIAPRFSFLSLSFTYDAELHYLTLRELSHPLLSEGVISYRWFKDGEELSYHGGQLPIKSVSDSGKYKCLFTFSYKSDSLTVETPAVSVTVTKAVISPPSIPMLEYNGEMQYPDISSLSLYTVEREGAVNAGVYPVKITLTDPENYSFSGSEESEITVDFIIKKANNLWIEEPSVRDFYFWQTPSPIGTSKFGEIKYSFSLSEDGDFSENAPSEVGSYYMKASIEETENYTGLVYPLIPVLVLDDTVEALYIIFPAAKSNYVAFESFDTEGLSVAVGYVSGRELLISVSELSIDYHSGENHLLYGDKSVVLSYGGASVLHPVSVSLAEYDISSVVFEDCSFEYSGGYQAPIFSAVLPVGLDRIPLTAEVVGGGTGVGSYGIRLVFASQSKNYRIPEPITKVMTVQPKNVDVIWENLSFVYDGTPKQPTAYYTDLNGRKIPLTVSGARSYAGSYEAKTVIFDSNYKADNTTAYFTVLKADYDLSGVFWSTSNLTYNGTEQKVTLLGLPEGVSVIGYSDNRAVNAGSYKANATLSYDTVNYNQPSIAPFSWSIIPAVYDESCMEFLDGEFVYDGEEHFPILSGNLPVGLDGSSPTYSFSVGVTNVFEGSVAVRIDFKTDSVNYLAPESRERFVRILPKGITVVWSETSFVYNSSLLFPSAVADECEITVLGAKSDAGIYTALAKALDSNYKVLNAECEYEILKAENFWKKEPSIEGIYESGSLSPVGEAAFGITEYIYSSDKKNEIALPKTAGTYYFMAASEGDENHHPINCEWIEFEIVEVVPIGFFVTLNRTEFLTLDVLSSTDFTAYVLCNDSTTVEVPFSEIGISYENGDRLSLSDGRVRFSYLGFSAENEISIIKRDYDLSGVVWNGVHGVYDGNEKYASLTGLPEGVSVTSYVGNGVKNAGIYIVKALLSYDSENYNEPHVPDAVMTVEKQLIIPPDIESVEYSGMPIVPVITDSPLYSWVSSEEKDAGVYPVTYTVTDFSNYSFEGGTETLTKEYEIKRRKLKIKISDIELYLFGKQSEANFEIVEGEVAPTDSLYPSYQIGGSSVTALFDDPNYDIDIIDGEIIDYNRLSPEDTGKMILIVSLFLVFIVALVLIFLNRKKLYAYYRRTFDRGNREFIPSMPVLAEDSEEKRYMVDTKNKETFEVDTEAREQREVSEEENIKEDLNEIKSDTTTVIDATYADSAISDSLAKDLIRKDSEIETEGDKKRVINVDTLSRSFSSGDRVDINLLKKKSLIPYDTGYIKVLARGIIDKPLTVYANDFSLSAVKMIALSGGKSVKVGTATKFRLRSKGDFEKKT